METKDFEAVDAAKRDVLTIYRNDIFNYAGELADKVVSIFDQIPSQLSIFPHSPFLAIADKHSPLCCVKQSWRTPKGQRLESHTNARSLIACYRRDARTRRSHRIVDGRSMHSWAMPQQSIPLGKAVCIRCYPIFGGVITSPNPPSSHCLSVQRAQSAILGISRGNNKSH